MLELSEHGGMAVSLPLVNFFPATHFVSFFISNIDIYISLFELRFKIFLTSVLP